MMFERVSIIGVGRFGRLLAEILSEDFQVLVHGRRAVIPPPGARYRAAPVEEAIVTLETPELLSPYEEGATSAVESQASESAEIIRDMKRALGRPTGQNQNYVAFERHRIAWRHKPAEILFYAPELDADMKPDFR